MKACRPAAAQPKQSGCGRPGRPERRGQKAACTHRGLLPVALQGPVEGGAEHEGAEGDAQRDLQAEGRQAHGLGYAKQAGGVAHRWRRMRG